MRHKDFQLFNVPAALKYIIDFAATKVSPKIGNRLHVSILINFKFNKCY